MQISQVPEIIKAPVIDNIWVGTWEADLTSDQVVWNSAHELLMGYSPGSPQRSKKDFESRVHPEDFERVRTAMDYAVQTGSEFEVEFKVVWPDGSVHWLLSRGRPSFDQDGKPFRMGGTLIDITEKKRFDQANQLAHKYLSDWEERYRSLISVSANIVWTTDPIGQMNTTQSSWENYTGKTFSEYRDFGWLSCIHEEDRDKFMQAWARARDQQCPFQAEGRVWSLKDNGYRYFSARAVPLLNEKNQIKEWVGKFTDVHDRWMAQKALKENEERFRVALQKAPIAVCSTDSQLKYTWAQNSQVLFGDKEILGKLNIDLLEPKSAKRITDLKRKVFLSGKGQRSVLHLTVGEEKKIFDITVEPLMSDEIVQGVTMAALDITAAKRDEQIALAASSAKTQFLANMSHEIRTPIGVILGYSDLAIQNLEDKNSTLNYIKSIHRNAEHLLSLIGEILDLSKIEADKIELEPLPFDLPQLIQEITQGFNSVIAEKSLKIEVDSKLKENTVITDPTRLRQILNNMIGNAVKFTNKGSITIKLRTPNENTVCVSVKDTGIGLTTEQVEKLFMPFSQGDNSMSRRFGGTGLGLMVSKGLAKRLGGDLRLKQTKVNVGSEFELRFPAIISAISVEPFQKSTVDSVSNHLLGSRILLVEDSKDNQVIVTTFLKDLGAQIDIADDGLQGLKRVDNAEYDLILLDIQMPVIDGYETLRFMQERKVKAPIVALTAHALKVEREKALSLGFREYITKPVNRRGLIEKLNEILSQKEH
jgi:PAS domain S-box-containing protein